MRLFKPQVYTGPQGPVSAPRGTDSQQQALYDAEWEVRTRTSLDPAVVIERLVRRFPELGIGLPAPWSTPRIEVVPTGERCFADYNHHRIVLIDGWGCEPLSVLHEYAHFFTHAYHGRTVQAHGPQFAGNLLGIVGRAEQIDLVEKDTQRRLVEAFERHNVAHLTWLHG